MADIGEADLLGAVAIEIPGAPAIPIRTVVALCKPNHLAYAVEELEGVAGVTGIVQTNGGDVVELDGQGWLGRYGQNTRS